MKLADAKEIIQCLPKGKSRFYYFKDRYALLLLSLFIQGETSKSALKRSSLSKLLDKDVVKRAIKQSSCSALSAETFNGLWPARYECYFLTLGVWGSKYDHWTQTSRPGFNLVLQLNFSSAHDEPFRKWIDPEGERPFSNYDHPISRGPMHTLAWARIDIDLMHGEALIEELQTDWIRDALWARRRAVHARDTIWFYGTEMQKDRVIRYVDTVLSLHEAVWDEAMLSATIWFLRKELGISTVFFHTYESGARLKRISFRLPPRSVYSRLPRRFCFRATERRPNFLPEKARPSRSNRRYDSARFSVLDFNSEV